MESVQRTPAYKNWATPAYVVVPKHPEAPRLAKTQASTVHEGLAPEDREDQKQQSRSRTKESVLRSYHITLSEQDCQMFLLENVRSNHTPALPILGHQYTGRSHSYMRKITSLRFSEESTSTSVVVEESVDKA